MSLFGYEIFYNKLTVQTNVRYKATQIGRIWGRRAESTLNSQITSQLFNFISILHFIVPFFLLLSIAKCRWKKDKDDVALLEINTICWFTDVINFSKWPFWILPFVKTCGVRLWRWKKKRAVHPRQWKGRRKIIIIIGLKLRERGPGGSAGSRPGCRLDPRCLQKGGVWGILLGFFCCCWPKSVV